MSSHERIPHEHFCLAAGDGDLSMCQRESRCSRKLDDLSQGGTKRELQNPQCIPTKLSLSLCILLHSELRQSLIHTVPAASRVARRLGEET